MLLVGNFRGQANHALDKQEILWLDEGEVVPLSVTRVSSSFKQASATCSILLTYEGINPEAIRSDRVLNQPSVGFESEFELPTLPSL